MVIINNNFHVRVQATGGLPELPWSHFQTRYLSSIHLSCNLSAIAWTQIDCYTIAIQPEGWKKYERVVYCVLMYLTKEVDRASRPDFFSHPVALLSHRSRFGVVRQQIECNTNGGQKKSGRVFFTFFSIHKACWCGGAEPSISSNIGQKNMHGRVSST